MFLNQYSFEFLIILRERWASFSKWWYLKFWGSMCLFFPWSEIMIESVENNWGTSIREQWTWELSLYSFQLLGWVGAAPEGSHRDAQFYHGTFPFINTGFAYTWNSRQLHQHSYTGVANETCRVMLLSRSLQYLPNGTRISGTRCSKPEEHH